MVAKLAPILLVTLEIMEVVGEIRTTPEEVIVRVLLVNWSDSKNISGTNKVLEIQCCGKTEKNRMINFFF